MKANKQRVAGKCICLRSEALVVVDWIGLRYLERVVLFRKASGAVLTVCGFQSVRKQCWRSDDLTRRDDFT